MMEYLTLIKSLTTLDGVNNFIELAKNNPAQAFATVLPFMIAFFFAKIFSAILFRFAIIFLAIFVIYMLINSGTASEQILPSNTFLGAK